MQSVDNAVTDVALATKKFFKRVLPIMLVMLVCNQLNRSNIGYAQEHLHADVGIGAAAYGFGAGLFFIAYAIFELPSNVMMENVVVSPKIFTSGHESSDTRGVYV